MSSPDVPPPPAPVQDAKAPEAVLNKRKAGQAGTLLTSPSGVTRAALTTGAPTLLGS
jgi:hypothetical protein